MFAEIKSNRRWVEPLLRRAYAEAKEAENSQKKLNAALALLPVDDTHLPYLKDRLFRADAQDVSVIRQSLAGHKDTLVAECWRVLEHPTQEDRNDTLPAASAVAMYDPLNPRWTGVSADVANRLVAANAYVVGRWIDALRPAAQQLRNPVKVVFRDEKRSEGERTVAASALAEYLSDQPDELAELIMDATAKQFIALYPSVVAQSDRTAPLFESELAKRPPSKTGNEASPVDNERWDSFYKRQANAGVALIRMGRTEKSWPLLKHSPDPSLRSYLVCGLGPLGVEPGSLVAKLDQESDVSIRRALILGLGEYAEGRLSVADRHTWTKKLIDLYRNERDPGIHGAADWVLRQWRNEDQIEAIDKELGKLPLPTLSGVQGAASSQGNHRAWYVNSEGHTLVVVRGPAVFDMGEPPSQHRMRNRIRVSHGFAIATKEVTVQQFQRFVKENPDNPVKNYEPYSPEPACPRNDVAWYDAAAYCNWLSNKEGIAEDQWCYGPNEKGDYAEGMKLMPNVENRKGYRLPTEAEWEYSCRAGAATGYSFGEPWELLEKYGWYVKNSSNRTQPVGSLRPNDLGLFDLHGNVWEWIQDRGKPETEAEMLSEQINNDHRLLRGGTFSYPPEYVRSAFRTWERPADRSAIVGFRLARTYD
jgi:formylglycine-generating enzyme required for sulfatase activity